MFLHTRSCKNLIQLSIQVEFLLNVTIYLVHWKNDFESFFISPKKELSKTCNHTTTQLRKDN